MQMFVAVEVRDLHAAVADALDLGAELPLELAQVQPPAECAERERALAVKAAIEPGKRRRRRERLPLTQVEMDAKAGTPPPPRGLCHGPVGGGHVGEDARARHRPDIE